MIAKRSAKLYRCPDCRYVFSTDTSHFFSIYDNCPQCHSNSPKRCLEPEAIALTHRARESHPIIKTTVVAFAGEKGFKKASQIAAHPFVTTLPTSEYLRQKNPVFSGEVWLETSTLHTHSWDVAYDSPTNPGAHLYDSCQVLGNSAKNETLYGYYLVETDQMRRLRDITYQCGACFRTTQQNTIFCQSCLQTPNLSTRQLSNTVLLPLTQSHARKNAGPELLNEAIKRYTEKQLNLSKKEQRSQIESLIFEPQHRSPEDYHGKRWLVENGINIKHCRYDAEQDTFEITPPLPGIPEFNSVLRKRLQHFPYEYRIIGH